MTELELYKYITDNNIEWRCEDHEGESDVLIFPRLHEIEDFNNLLHVSILDEGGISIAMLKGYFAIWMKDICERYGINMENVFIKAEGTTISGTNSKFTHTTNRLTYNGAFTNSFLVTANATARSGGTNQVISIGIAKNGVIIDESEGIIRTTTSNVEHGGSTQAVLEMVANDYVELFVKNTSSTAIRITDFNFNVIKIPV